MRLTVAQAEAGTRLLVGEGDELIDLSRVDMELPRDVGALIAGGEDAREAVARAVETAGPDARVERRSVTAALPVPRPGKFICLGLNYAEHAKEGGHDLPDYPALFVRTTSSLLPAGAPIVRPRVSEHLDYEAELVAIVGRRARHVSEADALDHVFGYTTFNDVSVRDYQRKTAQWTPGKNFDATGPVGPVVVTADEVPDGGAGRRITSTLNGRVMQDANTSDMIFPTARTIAILSEFTTLEPGDMIALGTPEGVGHARTPPVWLKAGDEIVIEIEGIGRLTNPVVDEGA